MALERLELRMNPGKPDEGRLFDALNAQGDAYGNKLQFLKERLLCGFAIITKEIDALLCEPDPLAALDQRAQSMDSMHYRVLRILMLSHSRFDERVTAVVQPLASPVVQSLPPEPQPSVSAVKPISVEVPNTPPQTVVAVEENGPVKPAAKTHDWSSFAGLAGVKKGT
jgi:hypothetical protein